MRIVNLGVQIENPMQELPAPMREMGEGKLFLGRKLPEKEHITDELLKLLPHLFADYVSKDPTYY